MGILDLIERDHAKELSAAWDVYFDALDKDATDPKTVAAFKAAAATLGKLPADIAADRSTIMEARRLQRIIADGAGTEDQADAASQRMHESAEQLQRKIAELQKAHARLVHECRAVHLRFSDAQAAGHQLRDLAAGHPELGQRLR